ncbi:MAG: molybdopterin-dependent oxidoreductase [Maricaulaceae bacterium]|nr:molybdopterin-dependent oxidoreductase [Maricaulaceae bacterium]
MIRAVLILAATLTLAACGGEPRDGAGDMPVVTVYGAVSEAERGPSDPVTEPVFAMLGVEFERARAFTRADLAALNQRTVTADYPAGGAQRRFEGPLLRDVLAAAGAAGSGAVVTAIDGYQREIPAGRIAAHGVILAIRMDGAPLGLGGFGPAMLVWPRGDDAALSGMDDADWVWGVIAIEATSAD